MSRLRSYAWNYFAFHADQRMKVFQFYLVLCASLAAGFIALLPKLPPQLARLPSWACFAVTLLSVAFALLDRRNAHLVKRAEAALMHLDERENLRDQSTAQPHVLEIFASDEYETKVVPRHFHVSFTEVLRFIFFVNGITALGLGSYLWVNTS